MLENCNICPRNCNVNRTMGNKGYCKCDDKIKIALVSTHYFEEPCISGTNGSGTIFFSNCNMNCVFCQNYEISQQGKGIEVSIKRLAEIMIEQQERGVNNINLVTPTMYIYQIIEAIKIAKKNGLNIPIVYNSNGYENVEAVRLLDGYIDIYLPDLKYYSNEIAIKYSNAPEYFKVATEAIKEMQKQVGKNIFMKEINNDNNIIDYKNSSNTEMENIEKAIKEIKKEKNVEIMRKGLIIRHLILPNHIQNTKHVLKWIKENMPEDTYVSIMAQYFPTYKARDDESINRKINMKEYKEVEDFLFSLGLENGYMQDLGKHEKEYVPNFDLRNI